MSVIGNDNQKSVEAPAKLVGAKSLLSGSMAQFIVLVNGFILTFTIFATLYVFTQQMVDESFATVATETRDHLIERFEGLESSIEAASSTASFSGKIPSQNIVSIFNSTFSDNNAFQQIYWLESQPADKYVVHKLLRNKDNGVTETFPNIAEMHKHVIKSLHVAKDNTVLLSEETGGDLFARGDDHPLILARPVLRTDGQKDIVYGVTTVSRVLAPAFLSYRKTVQELLVTVEGAGEYKYVRPGSKKESSYNSLSKNFSIDLIGKKIEFSLQVDLNEREVFLKKIPVFVALFGFFITVIGALYVRSNQKQAMRLALMNQELGQKNTDLNSEILEREKLNLALRKQEKDNRAIIDAVSDIIFETSTDGKILFLNDTWQKITGFLPEQSVGRNLIDLLYMQDQAEQKSNLAQLVKGKKQAYRAFTRLRTSNGNFRAVELAISMLRQDENKEMRVVGTITDVEERRRAERALSEAEKKYRAIVENSASGIYQVTPEGQYLSANPAFATILGYDAPEDILREVQNVTSEIYCSGRERERSLREALRSGHIHTECQVRRRDGSIIWVRENLRSVKDEDDQLLYFEGGIEDVTQRKNTEVALREAMVHSDLANRAKSEFLANMSHELRTPLNSIIGFSDIIRNQAFGSVGSSEYMDYARDINESGKHLLQVINDILDVSRIEAGERQLNEGIVDLRKIVLASIDMLSPKIEANSIIISNFIKDDNSKIIGETHAVKQMIMNLLSNAVKFTSSGGRVSINTTIDDYGQMLVSITDTGIGLTDEEVEKALSPFGQVSTGFNRSESGTGLGLTLVQSLMELHGGSFELFSQKGVGTTATLVFPPKRVSQAGAKSPETV